MPIRLDWRLIHRFANLPGTTKQAFKQALVRLQLGHGVRNESTKPDNGEAVYKCTLHYPCTRKYKLVRSGETVLVYETGQHGTQIMHRLRANHPREITDQIIRQARHGITASVILMGINESFPEYRDRINRQQIQRIISSLHRRGRSGARDMKYFQDLHAAFSHFQVTADMLQFVKDGQSLSEEFLYFGGKWKNGHFACIVGGASMLKSLLWYIQSQPRGFALYMDAQHKIIRGEQKVAWIGASRLWYDESASLYRHTFVPFLMGIIDVECYEVYSQLLDKLGDLVDFFTSGNKSLSDVINLCVHDAHQGALKACRRKIPDVRNARCYYHLAKNLKDNRRRFGDDAPLVEHVKFALHSCPTDDLYYLLAASLIEEIELDRPSASNYLRQTLDPDQFGFPHIALTHDGLRGSQVLNNIVETFHLTVRRMLGRESVSMSVFVEMIVEVIRSLKSSSPQHFVRRPDTINLIEYQIRMMERGTTLFDQDKILEVTREVSQLCHVPARNRYFVVETHRFVPVELQRSTHPDATIYLKGVMASDFDEDNSPLSELPMPLDDVLEKYFRLHLVMAVQGAFPEVTCTCKDSRDWGCCAHGYAVEVVRGSKQSFSLTESVKESVTLMFHNCCSRYYPEHQQLRRANQGRRARNRGPRDMPNDAGTRRVGSSDGGQDVSSAAVVSDDTSSSDTSDMGNSVDSPAQSCSSYAESTGSSSTHWSACSRPLTSHSHRREKCEETDLSETSTSRLSGVSYSSASSES